MQAVVFVVYLVSAVVVIPRWGATGSALISLGCSVITLVSLSWYVLRFARRERS